MGPWAGKRSRCGGGVGVRVRVRGGGDEGGGGGGRRGALRVGVGLNRGSGGWVGPS